LQYDIASLLFDAKADLPAELRQELLDHYLDALGRYVKLERDAFMRHYYAYVYVRILQALGAYGFRGFYERKAHFLQSVPYALKNLRWLLHHVELPVELPTLMGAFRSMLASEKLQALASEADNLVVRIFSFRFTLACQRTRPVMAGDSFSMGEACRIGARRAIQGADRQRRAGDRLFESAGERASVSRQRVVVGDASVGSYKERGFKNLMVSFGCTGGSIGRSFWRSNWRSVCAPRMELRWRSASGVGENGQMNAAPTMAPR